MVTLMVAVLVAYPRLHEGPLTAVVFAVTGVEGYVETDTVTATAVDNDGEHLSASDQATVTITAGAVAPPPSIDVVKAVFFREISEPGGTAIYLCA